MSLRAKIVQDYQEYVNDPLNNIPTELRRALKSHERVPVFIDELNKQLMQVKLKSFDDRVKLKRVVHEFTAFFIQNLKRFVDEKHQSDLANLTFRKTEDRLDSQGNGAYEELGLKIQDGQTNQGS